MPSNRSTVGKINK